MITKASRGRITPFSVGRRWRCERQPGERGRCRVFDFVVIGPASDGLREPSTAKRYKRCRIECQCPGDRAGHFDGAEQDYSHAHLRKYGQLVEEITPRSESVKP